MQTGEPPANFEKHWQPSAQLTVSKYLESGEHVATSGVGKVAAEAQLIAAMNNKVKVEARAILKDMMKECEGRDRPQKDWTELKEPWMLSRGKKS